MKVLKFGGTSVGSAQRMKEVAKLITDGEQKIVVLSAMSGTTNTLVEISASGLCFLTVITVNVQVYRIIACFLITLSHRQFRFMHCAFQESQQALCRCLYDSGRYQYGSHPPHLIRSAPSCGIRYL